MADAPAPANTSSRRLFLRNSSLLVAGGAIAASQVQIAKGAHAFGSDTIKLGLVGCGGRNDESEQKRREKRVVQFAHETGSGVSSVSGRANGLSF